MDITPIIPAGRQIIQSYGAGGFTINGVRLSGSVLVFAERSFAWPVVSPEGIDEASLALVLKTEPRPELLLLGTGQATHPVAGDLRHRLKEAGVAVESMDSGAACRTFNVLLAEERRVAAAIIAVA